VRHLLDPVECAPRRPEGREVGQPRRNRPGVLVPPDALNRIEAVKRGPPGADLAAAEAGDDGPLQRPEVLGREDAVEPVEIASVGAGARPGPACSGAGRCRG
jgi:hypothetical protein